MLHQSNVQSVQLLIKLPNNVSALLMLLMIMEQYVLLAACLISGTQLLEHVASALMGQSITQPNKHAKIAHLLHLSKLTVNVFHALQILIT